MLTRKEKDLLLNNPAIALMFQDLWNNHGHQVARNYLKVQLNPALRTPVLNSDKQELIGVRLPEDNSWVEEIRLICEKHSYSKVAKFCGVKPSTLNGWIKDRHGCITSRNQTARRVYAAYREGIRIA